MRIRVCALLLVSLVGCGFESRVEGAWTPTPGSLEAKQLVARGVPGPTAKELARGTFVAEDGVVYLQAVHESAALARYVVEQVQGDCATIRFEGAEGSGRSKPSESVEACLHDDALTLRHSAGRRPLEVTFRRQ